jgi:hypothetical protein
MRRFPWFEAFLVIALAAALILKKPSRVVSAAEIASPAIEHR